MIVNAQAFHNGQYKQRGVLVNVDKLPLHTQIRVKRVVDGLSQSNLVELLELPSLSFLSRIERGEKAISQHYMERFERYLYEQTYVDEQLQQEGNEE